MHTFYFTYGTEGQPYCGGWTEVIACDRESACNAFRAIHPDKIPGLLNCSSVYNRKEFHASGMYLDGNFGHRCREVITVRRSVIDNG